MTSSATQPRPALSKSCLAPLESLTRQSRKLPQRPLLEAVPDGAPRLVRSDAGTLGTITRVRHRGQRAGWLRAAVLGANDGIVSVVSVAIGVIASGAPT